MSRKVDMRRCHSETLGLFICFLVANCSIAYGVDEKKGDGKEIQTGFKLKIYGWSNDEKYWAFAESGDYSGGALAGTTLRYYIIDSARNTFFKKYEYKITEQEGYDEEVEISEAVSKAEKEAEGKMQALGLSGARRAEVYKKPLAVWVDHDSVIRQFGEKNVSFVVDKDRYDLKLDDKIIEGKDRSYDKKSMFSLFLRKNGGEWRTLQADKTPLRSFLQYRIVYVSVSPSRAKLAVIIEAIEYGFEGAKIVYYKGITGAL